ncbi:MAG: type II toxin-antitoxin system VapC family toxin [Pirellulales bacterium]
MRTKKNKKGTKKGTKKEQKRGQNKKGVRTIFVLVNSSDPFLFPMRGWLAGIRRARDVADQVRPYDQLINLVRFFQAWDILRFDENCAARFLSLRQQGVRIGTLDLKIASITLAHDAILLSANARDFNQVPGLRTEDWLHA